MALGVVTMETAPLGVITSLTKNAASEIIGPQAELVPARGAIFEQHLELAVIVHVGRYLAGQTQSHAADLHRPRVSDLAHHIDIVHAAVDDGRGGLQQRFVAPPAVCARLLVEVKPEYIWAAQFAGLGDEAHPRRVVPQDIADDQLAPIGLGGRDDALGIGHGGGEGLFNEDVGTLLQRHDGVVGVGVGVGIDRDQIGLVFPESACVVGLDCITAQIR